MAGKGNDGGAGGEHYYTPRPTSKPRLGLLKAVLGGREYKFVTSSGVFSPKRVDRGTALLAEHLEVKDGDKVLDMGCGYGVLGIVAARRARCRVVMTEINARAAALARRNLELNSVEGEVREGNLYEPLTHEVFDTVICNLPMSAGLRHVFEIIDGAKGHLRERGSLQVVVRKGSGRVEERMFEAFGNVETVAKRGGYRVLVSKMPG